MAARLDGDILEVEVCDSGPGWETASAPAKSGGLGLSIMRDRIASLGGTLSIESDASAGTRLCARLHLKGG